MKKIKNLKYIDAYIIFIICIIYFLYHLPTLNNAPWELYDSWRQSDTYSIAQNYFNSSMNPFLPRFNYDSAETSVVQLELQIVPYISAIIFKIIGQTTPFIPRLLSLLFFLGSAIFVYKTVRRETSLIPALIGLVLYLITPINLLYSRAIMPESTALFFFSGTIWFLLVWYKDDNIKSMWLSAIFTAFSIMEKIPTIFIGLLILFIFIKKLGVKSFKNKKFYIYGVVSLGIPICYYAYSHKVASATFVTSIASKHILTEKIFSIFTTESQDFFFQQLPEFFGSAILISVLIGIVICFKTKRWFFIVLAASFVLELITIVSIIKFGYYLIFISPICTIIVSIFIYELLKWKKSIALVLSTIIILLTGQNAYALYKERVIVDYEVTAVSEFVKQNTEKDSVVSFATYSPIYINACERCGFRANIEYYDHIPIGAKDEINYFISNGADYFIFLKSGTYNDSDGNYMAFINKNFPIHAQNEYCTIFTLTGVVK